MSPSETKTLAPKTLPPQSLNVSDLKTVKWVQDISLVKQSSEFSSDVYKSAKRRVPVFYWILASIEMVFISLFLFIHSLPWPNWMLNIIHKIDHVIENFLEFISNKFEWWWDIFMIRMMWLKDSLEAFVNAILSMVLFFVYMAIDVFMWTVSVALNVLKIIFFPVIWVVNTILPPVEKTPAPPSVMIPIPEYRGLTSSSLKSMDVNSAKEAADLEEEGQLSATTSDCESDVSVVSESWSIGHTNKSGASYNRLQMKATAEGKLRAAMYKRVKGQLSLMRKNSVVFSQGMTSYIRQALQPRVTPAYAVLKEWLQEIALKLGLLDTFDRISKWVNSHYLLSVFVSFALSIALMPITILDSLLAGNKKKSRRTRSMRSESLRRRTVANGTNVPPIILEPIGLIKSKEPVVEEAEFCSLRRLTKLPLKDEEDLAFRDSALASSIDDLCVTSDSNDGSNSLKDQTIHEEDERGRENHSPRLDGKRFSLTEPLIGEEKSENERKYSDNTQIKPNLQLLIPTLSSKTKTSKTPASPSTIIKQEKALKNGSAFTRDPINASPIMKTGLRFESYAQVAKSEENLNTKDQLAKSGKPPKRKISFNLESTKMQ